MRQKITHIVRNPLFQAFILPMLLWTVCTWQPPLGNNTLIFSDCREQYYPFFWHSGKHFYPAKAYNGHGAWAWAPITWD